MRLGELIEPLERVGMRPAERLAPAERDLRIGFVASDSRAVRPGCLFVALEGTHLDGHAFIAEAAHAGSVAIVGGDEPAPEVHALLRDRGVRYLRVADPAEALGHLAAVVNGRPSEAMTVVGVTGTNGKTTVSTLLFELFTLLGQRCGLIGTTGIRIHREHLPTSHTTPDALTLQAVLARMARAGCRYCFMEVTSHAIDQRRIAAIDFDGGIFTNLDCDHLDYHRTMDAYAAVKQRFLGDLPEAAFALSNADDERGRYMVETTRARVTYYGRGPEALLPWSVHERDEWGMGISFGPHRARTTLIGDHNAGNLAAAVTAAALLGVDGVEIAESIPRVRGARGRLQRVVGRPVLGIVDYAHTPGALRHALATARALRPRGKLLVVGGCGGDRDHLKRPAIGALIATADVPVFTADNPRSEAPQAIVEAMLEGAPARRRAAVRIELDRGHAIELAVREADAGDVVLVTGKGHETTHECASEVHPFDDCVELRAALERRFGDA